MFSNINHRSKRIVYPAVAAAFSKVLAMAVPIITVKWALGYLGQEIYGLWGAVTSFFTLFAFADLGLGNGLQTALSRAYGKEDGLLQSKIIYNTYVLLILIAAILIISFVAIYPFVNWAKVMNVETEKATQLVGPLILAMVIPRLLNIPLSLVQRVQLAYQEGYNSHLWQSAGTLLNLLFVFVICKMNLGPVALVGNAPTLSIIIFTLNSVVYYYANRNRWVAISLKLIDLELIKKLLSMGGKFLLLSILTTIGLTMDTFIVAKTTNLSDAGMYSILYKLTSFVSVACAMISTPLWAANGEAIAKGDYSWVRNTTKKVVVISLAISIFAGVLLSLCAIPILNVWLKENYEYSYWCIIGLCVMQIILSGISPCFMVLNAANVITKQIVAFSFFIISSISLKLWLAPSFGLSVIPWISVICYTVIVIPVVLKCVGRILTQDSKVQKQEYGN
jgi:O-antigen/teichoic acid export membrane protein